MAPLFQEGPVLNRSFHFSLIPILHQYTTVVSIFFSMIPILPQYGFRGLFFHGKGGSHLHGHFALES